MDLAAGMPIDKSLFKGNKDGGQFKRWEGLMY